MPDQDDIQHRYEQALMLAARGETDEAIAALGALLDDAPNLPLARSDMAALLYQQGRHETARAELARAFREMPDEENIVANYLEVLLATDAVDDITPALQSAVGTVVQDTTLLERMLDAISLRNARDADHAALRLWDASLEDGTQLVTDQILPYLTDGGVLIDVGANCGLFTEQLLRQVNVSAYLFEPVPRYANYCAHKFRDRADVVVENMALADSAGALTLYVDDTNLGWNTLVDAKRTDGMREVTVPALTFDAYVQRNGITRIDVIKIDVEGAEYRVLRGMRETLQRMHPKPVIICEVGWGPAGHPNWSDEVEAFEWLIANGYQRVDYAVASTRDVLFLPV